jgi:hypothetical protein
MIVEAVEEMRKPGIAGEEADELWHKQDVFDSLYFALGLEQVDPSFKWKDYCLVDVEVQKWTDEESGKMHQGMRNVANKTLHGIVKISSEEDGTIEEASFKEGKRFGFSREVTATQVSLKLYGKEEEVLGEIVWNQDFFEIDR